MTLICNHFLPARNGFDKKVTEQVCYTEPTIGKGGSPMKKFLLAAVIVSMLIVPLGNTVLADQEEGAPSPAGSSAVESVLPSVHGAVLAMLNRNAASFDPDDSDLAWESLYNMLSLYGQLDSRCDPRSGELTLPEEAVWDYAAALDLRPDSLPPLPDSLSDRIVYDGSEYRLTCGDAGLARLQIDSLRSDGGYLFLDCSLVDHSVLARFQVTLQPRNNMFGFAVSALTEA